MILVDLNQVMISNLMMQIVGKNNPIEEDLVRHMILNSLRMHRAKHKDKFGELVICSDGPHNWRKDFYERFSPIVKNANSAYEAAAILNNNIFKKLDVELKSIVFAMSYNYFLNYQVF